MRGSRISAGAATGGSVQGPPDGNGPAVIEATSKDLEDLPRGLVEDAFPGEDPGDAVPGTG
jgi:hypothetical protein